MMLSEGTPSAPSEKRFPRTESNLRPSRYEAGTYPAPIMKPARRRFFAAHGWAFLRIEINSELTLVKELPTDSLSSALAPKKSRWTLQLCEKAKQFYLDSNSDLEHCSAFVDVHRLFCTLHMAINSQLSCLCSSWGSFWLLFFFLSFLQPFELFGSKFLEENNYFFWNKKFSLRTCLLHSCWRSHVCRWPTAATVFPVKPTLPPCMGATKGRRTRRRDLSMKEIWRSS